ncbi:MAG TPA: S8 family serine peptidase [Thermoanaerobaculia bacterium]|nr:S8 family serine peptidase [Thermoanaerobaculia bacterium]
MVLGALLLQAGASAAFGAGPEIEITPTTLYYGAAQPPALSAAGKAGERTPPTPPAVWRSLKEKAERQGTLRVLVRVAAAFAPEGQLDNAQAVASQRREIDTAQDAVLGQLGGANARVNARFETIPFLALSVDAPALDRLANLPGVLAIEEDVADQPSLASSNVVIGTNVAVTQGLTGGGQVIAVLDTGVDKTHPFFAGGKVVSEACYSTTSVNDGSTSLCPGGVAESTASGSGVNCGAYGCEHGTHVAGIAAGNDGTGPGFGVARDAGIIAIQVFSQTCGGSCLGAWVSDQIRGLERVYELADDFDIAAVNMSLGGGGYSSRESCDAANAARKAVIDNLRSIDIPTVAAAGNSGYTGYLGAPACISSAVSVSATDDADAVPYFANVATFLDLLAPGVDITSSVPGGATESFDGTSMASPHVAGAWAVLRQANPGATVSEILSILRNTSVSVSGWGVSDMRRINLGKALLAGPFETETFTIHNTGNAVLSVLDMELETPVSWIRWSPEAPFDLAPGGSREVSVSVDFGRAPAGASSHRIVVTSTDADESPYPDAVYLMIDKQPCHPLTRSRTGSGGFPLASPPSSPGCPAGHFLAGEAIQLTASPATGWNVLSWSGTDDDTGTSLSKTVTMTAGGRSVSVAYVAQCYTLTRAHTGSGTDPVAVPANSAGCPAGQYRYAEEIELTASPTPGWRVGSWTGTDNNASYKKTNTTVMPASGHTVSVTYLEGVPSVLLVEDLDSYYTSGYVQVLNSLGILYQDWKVSVENGLPDAATLASYPKVVWDSGYDGLSPAAETLLANYLNNGGGLFASSWEAIGSVSPGSFTNNYLGVAGVSYYDEYMDTVRGQGSGFSGLGPYDFYTWAYILTPAPGAETAFTGLNYYYGNVSIGVSKIAPGYRTVFLPVSINSFDTEQARKEVTAAALDFVGTVFADVPPGHWAKKWVESIYRAGITAGCSTNPRNYCPGSAVTREQMAVFLLRSLEGSSYVPPPCTTNPFSDVSAGNGFCPWIQELALRGMTSGCGGGKYCPGAVVSRDQMAIFLMRALEGNSYTPVPCLESPFVDVAASHPYCGYIRDLAARGITGGCGGGKFCPSSPTSRAEMAVFLVKTFSIPLL